MVPNMYMGVVNDWVYLNIQEQPATTLFYLINCPSLCVGGRGKAAVYCRLLLSMPENFPTNFAYEKQLRK